MAISAAGMQTSLHPLRSDDDKSSHDSFPLIIMTESLQQLILDHLQAHGSILDSRNLTIPGATSPATDAEAQIAILGALNSLLSREVSDLPSP